MATKKSAGKKTAATAVVVIGLAEIVAAGANGMFVPESVYAPLVEAGLVEINPAMTDDNGYVATRATQAGIESLDSGAIVADNATSEATSATAETGKTEKVKTMFQIKKRSEVNVIKSARGRQGTQYPFDELDAGDCFFVANSEDKPNAAKSLASTVSSATARYAVPAEDGSTKTNKKGEVVPVMVKTRKFVVERGIEDGIEGAYVTRTA